MVPTVRTRCREIFRLVSSCPDFISVLLVLIKLTEKLRFNWLRPLAAHSPPVTGQAIIGSNPSAIPGCRVKVHPATFLDY
jgi:hypothetical protein